MNIGAPEAIIALVIILVLFGGSQLPKLARNLGKAQKEFKDGLADGQAEGSESETKPS
jgi:sec-independent protein translocase protein TatA